MKTELYAESTPGQRNTWVWAVPVLAFVFLIGGQLLTLLPANALGLISRETVETYPTILYLIIGAFAVAALIFILWIRFFERRSLASVGLGITDESRGFYLRGFGFGLLMAAAVVYGVRVLGGYSVEAEVSLQLRDLAPIFVLMFAFILQSTTEELIFRGWMMARIAARYGLWAGVIGNSVLFTLMHVDLESPAGAGILPFLLFTSTTMLFSVFLSFLAIREKSIWGASAWHASWNWMFITWFGLPTTGIELGLVPLVSDLMPTPGAAVWLTGGTDGPEGSVLTPIVLTVGCLLLLWLRNLRQRESSQ